MRPSPLPYLRRYIRQQAGQQVCSGLYRLMRWPERPGTDVYETKVLGIYEKEIYPTLDAILHLPPQSLTIIGAAEGYHAIGLALGTGLRPVCFEANSRLQEQLAQQAHCNGVAVDIRGRFDSQTRVDVAPGLILMDIEGAEATVLTPDRLTRWQAHHLIIEVHGPAILKTLEERARSFFHTGFVPAQPRTVHDYPMAIPFPRLLRRWWQVPVQEWRSDSIGWLVLEPI